MSKNRTLADFISTSSVSAEEIANGAVTVVKLANTTSSNGTSLIQMSGHSTALNITPSGRIGINTNNPLVPLHIENEGMRVARNTGDAYIQLTEQGNTHVSLYGGPNGFRVFNGASESLRINSSGNVGIGTTSPASKLHIYTTSYPGLRLDDGTAYSTIYNDSTDGSLVYSADDQNARANSKQLFYVDGSERMRIDSSGNLLVGKTAVNTFNEGLVVTRTDGTNITSNSSTVLDLNRRTTDGAIIALRKDNTLVGQIGNATDFWIASADGAGLRFTNSQILPCDENGNLQNTSRDLGSTGGQYRNLHLSGTSYSNFVQLASSGSAVFFENSDYLIQGSATNGYMRFLTNNSEAMRINSSGVVNINQTSATGGRLNVSNASGMWVATWVDAVESGNYFEFRDSGGNTHGVITASGSGLRYATSSDRRLKTDIQPISKAIDKVRAINPVTYRWKKDPSGEAMHGFIAQEMQNIIPEAVSGTQESEDMMSVDYGRITPVIVAALQDALKEIDMLKKNITEASAKIAQLEAN